MTPVDHVRAELSRIYGGRRWLLAFDVLAALPGVVRDLAALGADASFVIAAARGTGPAPCPALAPHQHVLGVTGRDMMDGIRRAQAALADVPDDVQRAVDAWDPTHEVRSIGTIFDDGRPVAGRAKFGARPPAWQALEDKIRVEDLWDALDVPRAPHRVVPACREGLEAAHAALDQGLGTVWSADDRDGWHGGATGVRWVLTPEERAEAADDLGARCDRVRVMPFVEGIPCSIHGIVFPDHVVVLRPCEMVVLREQGVRRLWYARAGTTWDPPTADRVALRALARRVGEHLRSTLGYRGAFTIDGVLGADGFVPTELNPRYGAALGVMTARLPRLPTLLLNLAVVEGVPADWRPETL